MCGAIANAKQANTSCVTWHVKTYLWLFCALLKCIICYFSFYFVTQCMYILHSVWALQLLTRPKSQPRESQNPPLYSWTRLPSSRPQQVGICPDLMSVLTNVKTCQKTLFPSSEGSTEGVTGAFVKRRSSVLKRRSDSLRRKWRRSGSSWGWRGEGCSGAQLAKGAPRPSCYSRGPPRQTAQSKNVYLSSSGGYWSVHESRIILESWSNCFYAIFIKRGHVVFFLQWSVFVAYIWWMVFFRWGESAVFWQSVFM